MTTYAIRAKEYHGRAGFHIGSRGNGGWPVSIFVEQRADAELIRDALNAERDGFITADERDAYELIAFHMDPAQARP
jgi:hypothetical protein